MNIVFFHSNLNLGGLETQIIRISNWLVSVGNDVSVVLLNGGEMVSLLDKRVRCIDFGATSYSDFSMFSVARLNIIDKDTDVVCVYDGDAIAFAALCMDFNGNKAKLFAGIVHPSAFCLFLRQSWRAPVLRILYTRVIPKKSIVFMNDSCRFSHEYCTGVKFDKSQMLPLAINNIEIQERNVKKYKIASVGRLVSFKSYNLYMIDVVDALVRAGYSEVTWHVYGDGELESSMREKISKLNLGRYIYMHGSVPYHQLSDAIRDAAVFVGMGTSLIETGLMGIPGVVAVIDTVDPYSYGYTYDLKNFNVGENTGKFPSIGVYDLVRKVFDANLAAYEIECKKTRNHCEQFLIDGVGSRFLRLISELGSVNEFYLNGGKKLAWLNFMMMKLGELKRKLLP